MAQVEPELEQVEQKEPFKPAQALFFDSLQAFKAPEWERNLVLYLYRLQPRRPGTDKNPYICKYTQPVTEDEIKQAYGSGVYQLRLHRANPATHLTKQIDAAVITIEDPALPPIMPGVDNWELDPANKRWAWAKKPEAVPVTAATVPLPPGWTPEQVMSFMNFVMEKTKPKTDGERADVTSAAIEAMKMANKQSLEMVVSQAESQSPSKIVEMFKALGEITNAREPDTGKDRIFDLLIEEMRTNREIMKAAMTRTEGGGGDVAKQADGLLGLLTKLKELFGFGGEAGTGHKPGIAEIIAPFIPEALGRLDNMIANITSAVRGTAPPPSTIMAVSNPALPPGAPTITPQQQQQLIQLGNMVIAALQRDQHGSVLASAVQTLDPLGYEQIRALGQDEIMRLIQMHPAWPQLAPIQARVAEFVQEFIEGPDEGEAESGGAPEPPVPETAAPKERRKREVKP